jgi:hypothetical protein
MADDIMFPSLSEDGWINSSMKIADYLLSHFFISDYSQSYLYIEHVSSLPWIIQKNQSDIPKTCSDIQSTLVNYFSRYFDNVEVEVIDVTNADAPSKVELTIYLKFIDKDNKEYVFGKLLEIANMTITKIIDINNG